MLPTGGMQDLLSHDSALAPEEVAERVWETLADDRFFILPHLEVAGYWYYASRATDTDRWLAGMKQAPAQVGGVRALSAGQVSAPEYEAVRRSSSP